MPNPKTPLTFSIRKVKIEDIKHVYPLLTANRPYVGLNSRYTYFLLAKDFSSTCVVAEYEGKIVAFSSGYVPPERPDTFFSWEAVVHPDYRGYALQKQMLLHQISMTNARYFEGTVNPSNAASKKSFQGIAKKLHAPCEETLMFSEEDFGNDGHEAEYLLRIGPMDPAEVKKQLLLFNCKI